MVDELDAEGFVTKLVEGSGVKKSRVTIEDTDELIEAGIENIEINHQEVPVVLQTVEQDSISSDLYKMDHPRRGKAVVINMEKFSPQMQKQGFRLRMGTDVDCNAICLHLEALGFEVDVFHNPMCDQILKIFHEASNEDHTDADCFVTVILTHGEDGMIVGYDGKIQIKEIFHYFKAHLCRSLAGKPKLFFIQACRGKEFDNGVEFNTVDAKRKHEEAFDEDDIITSPNEPDFLLSFSTAPGYFSWRNQTNGSWYIQELVFVLGEMGTTTEIQKLLTKLNKRVANKHASNTSNPANDGKKQIPSFTSMLTKDLYFKPKF